MGDPELHAPLSTEEWERLRTDLERSIHATNATLARTEALLLASALLHAPSIALKDSEPHDDDGARQGPS